jgi:hypothetical protein
MGLYTPSSDARSKNMSGNFSEIKIWQCRIEKGGSHPIRGAMFIETCFVAYQSESTDIGRLFEMDCAPFLRQRVKLQFLRERSNCGDISKDFHAGV